MRHDSDHNVSTEDLVAYAEGRLPNGSRAAERIEVHLASHPEDAARVDAFRRQDACIQEIFDGVVHEPIPTGVLSAARPAHRRRVGPALGVAAMLFVALAAGWVAARWSAEPLRNPAIRTFAERVAGRFSPADSTMTPVAQVPGMPNLSGTGLQPVAAGRAPDMPRNMHRFEYRAPSGNAVYLFRLNDIARAAPTVRVMSTGDQSVAYWHRGHTTYALSGRVTPAYLRGVAPRVAEALNQQTERVLLNPSTPNSAAGAASGDDAIAVTPDSGGGNSRGVQTPQGGKTVKSNM